MSDSEGYQLSPEEPRHRVTPALPLRPESGRSVEDEDHQFVRRRLKSLDVYRGLIMISLAFGGFGLARTAANYLQNEPENSVWTEIQQQFSHAEWVGCNYWDLIQPSFMFMVGVSFAYSYSKRKRMGHSYLRMLCHALWRSVVLILLGIFLTSCWQTTTNWSLMNVLSQIGLGYTFVFLMWNRTVFSQFLVAGIVLACVWAGYFYYPQLQAANSDVVADTEASGVTPEWAQANLVEVGDPWKKNANLGHEIDLWLLNQVPQQEPFQFNRGGYQTINFIPSFVTMLFGLMSGELLRADRSQFYKLLILILAGATALAAGWFIDATGFCPLVKRIWTPSWTLFSTGWCCLILASIYFAFDILPLGILALPVVVVGVNSLAIYCMSMLLKPWVARNLETHFGEQVFRLRVRWGEEFYRLWFVDDSMEPTIVLFQPTIQAVMTGLVFWCLCCWMYRQKIFVRI